MNRALITAWVALGVTTGMGVSALGQLRHRQHAVHGAIRVSNINVPFEVQIEPTTLDPNSSSIEIAEHSWNLKGVDLKTLIGEIYNIDTRRVELAGGLDDARYDLRLSLPTELDGDSIERVLTKAIEQKFGVRITHESRVMDVYVLNAPNGTGDGLHRHVFPHHSDSVERLAGIESDQSEGQITYMGRNCPNATSEGITVAGGTIAEFRQTLEPDLDRVLVDETHLTGSYDFKIGTYANQDQLFQLMRAQLGLVVTPEQREIGIVTVRPAGMLEAKL